MRISARCAGNALLDWLAPRICVVCRELLVVDDTTATVLCTNCTPDETLRLAYSGSHCNSCGEQTASGCCPLCVLAPLPLRSLRSAWCYEAGVEEVVKSFKYHGGTALAGWMVRSMNTSLQQFERQDWDCIVAIPSAHSQNLLRGYAHLQPLARTLCNSLALPLKELLVPTRRVRIAQAQLQLYGRQANIAGAFQARKVRSGMRVLLIDDVCTTGATLCEAAHCLLAAGVEAVDAITFARSSLFRRNRIAGAQQHDDTMEAAL